VIELLVAADDRTGALEAAGACADAGSGPALTVTTMEEGASHEVVVIDLASRHVSPGTAAERAVTVEGLTARRMAHKIDSLLRGNWAAELVARHRASGRRVLVVPAAPALGRTCVGGVVFDHGQPVDTGAAGDDARAPVRSSRPVEHLKLAGAVSVATVDSAERAARWMRDGDVPFAVCDATTAGAVETLARLWASTDGLLLAGPAAVIGAGAGVGSRAGATGLSSRPPSRAPAVTPPVLVVAGSLHGAARRQVEALVATGAAAVPIEPGLAPEELDVAVAALAAGGTAVLTTAVPAVVPVGHDEATRTACALAAACRQVLAAVDVATLVVLGGDTAAAVLGPEPLAVGGTVAPGTPWARRGDGVLVVTRAGGFGTDAGLVELIAAKVAP
jgi:uncharacterized protein YgbK (DUF1537 family)